MATVALTEQDFVAAQLFISRHRHSTLLKLWDVLIIFFATTGAAVATSGAAAADLGYILLAWVALGLIVQYLVASHLTPWAARRQYWQNRRLRLPNTLSWTDDALTTPGAHGVVAMPWSDFSSYADNAGLFLLLITPQRYLCIPKHSLTDAELADLQRTLHAHVRQQ